MHITGPDRKALDKQGDEFAAMVVAAVERALKVATKDLKATTTPDDLGAIKRVLAQVVDDDLIPYLQQTWITAASDQRKRFFAATTITAAAGDFVLPPTRASLSEQYLATARNRLVGVSDEVWGHARSEMLAGMQAGESIPQIRRRITGATELAAPRATTIARTEVIGATNRGSLAQMQAADIPSTKKTWLATEDDRTRPSHADANGQTVDMSESFDVGGSPMDGPHDPAGDAGETINCRCTLTYAIPDDAAPTGGEDTSADSYQPAQMSEIDQWDFSKVPAPTDSFASVGDPSLSAMWKQQGFDGLPAVVSSSDLDAAIQGGAKEIFRGLSGPDAAKYAEQFRSGEAFAGTGNYGNGTYFGIGPGGQKVATQYAGTSSNQGTVIRAALRADAKVASWDDIGVPDFAFLQKLGPDIGPKLFDAGRLATALGYDAMTAMDGEYLIVLNRTALMVEKAAAS